MKRRLFELFAIFLIAWGLRFGLMYYRLTTLGITPLESSPQAIEYKLLGQALLYRGEWSNGGFIARPPLLPLLIAGVYRLFGEVDTAVGVVNTILGAATACVVYALADRLTHDAGVARLAGLLAAIDAASIVNNINLQAETLTNFCLALAMLWLVFTVQRPTAMNALVAGLWMGLAALARPTTLYLFVFCAPLFVLLFKPWLRLYILFAVLPLAFVLGWCARNFFYIGEFTYSSVADFNMLFYRAVSVERWARGGADDVEIRRQFSIELERRLGNPVDETQIDAAYFWWNFAPQDGRRVRLMRAMALEVFRAHPFWYFATVPPGLIRMYAYTDFGGNPFWPEIAYNSALYLSALAGAVICWKQKQWPTLWLTGTVIFYVTLATLMSQTTGMDTRMRTSTTIAWAVLAGIGLVNVWASWAGRARARAC
ncbi:MAG TPA: glycosyltransferase family 39 protein [Anaerolineales bacterium]|nr:glycosyltransferase family 39 protein [Anaerolineales bacterium]